MTAASKVVSSLLTVKGLETGVDTSTLVLPAEAPIKTGTSCTIAGRCSCRFVRQAFSRSVQSGSAFSESAAAFRLAALCASSERISAARAACASAILAAEASRMEVETAFCISRSLVPVEEAAVATAIIVPSTTSDVLVKSVR